MGAFLGGKPGSGPLAGLRWFCGRALPAFSLGILAFVMNGCQSAHPTPTAQNVAKAIAEANKKAKSSEPDSVGRVWKSIPEDGLHDPENPAIYLLQNPSEALSRLPPDPSGGGNKTDWTRALKLGLINPRTNFMPETKVNFLDLDVHMKDTGEMPEVMFPHSKHTLWLDCSNCHTSIFKEKAGATKMNMFTNLQGKHCGQCHGAVAFPLTDCLRCHNVPRNGNSVKHVFPPE